jgi:hypothetical protein
MINDNLGSKGSGYDGLGQTGINPPEFFNN